MIHIKNLKTKYDCSTFSAYSRSYSNKLKQILLKLLFTVQLESFTKLFEFFRTNVKIIKIKKPAVFMSAWVHHVCKPAVGKLDRVDGLNLGIVLHLIVVWVEQVSAPCLVSTWVKNKIHQTIIEPSILHL